MSEASFPKNAWYAIAWTNEAVQKLVARQICGKKMVFYRTSGGKAVVLDDSCWHRLLPLSLGYLEGDNVVCGYHGLAFEPGGRCVHMPSQDTINPSACVRSYPVEERHRLIWVWTGDPALADPAKIPDLHWQDDAEWAGDGGRIHVNSNYRLVVDNLMDLTHETYVHAGSIGNEAVAESPFSVSHKGRTATVTRWMINSEPAAFWKNQLKKIYSDLGLVDRWQIIEFEAPCSVKIDVGAAPTGTGAPEGDRSKGINGYVVNTITPETESTSHYFWSFCRNYNIQDQSLTNALRDGVRAIFAQDEVVLEAQQRAMDEQPDKEFYNLNIDAGAMWARKKITDMIEEEKGESAIHKLAV